MHENTLYGDKAYQRPDADEVKQSQNLTVLTPVKKKKGQEHLDFDDQLFSTAISRVRQPIESLFAWIEDKTGIESARKVSSTHGLMVHIFGNTSRLCFFGIIYELALNSHLIAPITQ